MIGVKLDYCLVVEQVVRSSFLIKLAPGLIYDDDYYFLIAPATEI